VIGERSARKAAGIGRGSGTGTGTEKEDSDGLVLGQEVVRVRSRGRRGAEAAAVDGGEGTTPRVRAPGEVSTSAATTASGATGSGGHDRGTERGGTGFLARGARRGFEAPPQMLRHRPP